MTKKTVVAIGTLDTKEPEYRYLLECLKHHNIQVILLDISCQDDNTSLEPLFSCVQVAKRANRDFGEVKKLNKIEAGKVMVEGAKNIVKDLLTTGRLDGVIAMGGANGTLMAGEIMKSMKIFVPKVLISVVAAGDPRMNVGTMDIFLVNAVTDICLNRITGRIIANSATALAGMLSLESPAPLGSEKKLIASTMLGLTQPCVIGVKDLLEAQGYEVVVFHSNGIGGSAMEQYIEDGTFEGVLDLTINEVINHQLGGVFSSGIQRLEGTLKKGIPVLIAPGCLDFVNFWGQNIPPEFKNRNFIFHNVQNTLMRTLPEETFACGKALGDKINNGTGQVKVMIPLLGTSGNDRPNGPSGKYITGEDGGSWYNRNTVQAFMDGLKQSVTRGNVGIIPVDAHINDDLFIKQVTSEFQEMYNL